MVDNRSATMPKSPLQDRVAEPDAQDNVRRHTEHLERLAANLRSLGLDETLIDQQVTEMFRQYERELARYLDRARDRSPHGR